MSPARNWSRVFIMKRKEQYASKTNMSGMDHRYVPVHMPLSWNRSSARPRPHHNGTLRRRHRRRWQTRHQDWPPAGGGRTESAPDGSFSLLGLFDGTYRLCAVDKGAAYLDPCVWSDTPPTIRISAKQPISGYKLVLAKGSPLTVRINDAAHLLDAPSAVLDQMPATLIVGVVTARHTLQPLALTGKDSAGRNHQTAIPATKP